MLYSILCSSGQPLNCVLPVLEGATLSQINSLGSIQVCKPHVAQILFLQSPSVLPFIHTLIHMVTVDRSMVVGQVPMVHTCSFYVHQSYRHDSTHPGLFTSWGALPSSGLPSCKQRIAGFFFLFFFNFLSRNFSHGEIQTWDLPLGK